MSSQKGNLNKKGPPKHHNKTAFKNTLHDTSVQTQRMIATDLSGVCSRCKDVLQWKIKFKKYKPLTVSKKCTKCAQKTVKRAYYIICDPCSSKLGLCGKCGENQEVVQKIGVSAAEEASQQSQIKQELKFLSERKRRSFQRNVASGKSTGDLHAAEGAVSKELDEDENEDLTDSEDDGGQNPKRPDSVNATSEPTESYNDGHENEGQESMNAEPSVSEQENNAN